MRVKTISDLNFFLSLIIFDLVAIKRLYLATLIICIDNAYECTNQTCYREHKVAE